MGTIIDIPVSNGFYVHNSLPLSNQECINWVPINTEVSSLSGRVLEGTPGVVQLATAGDTGSYVNRGSHVMDEVPYFVNGTGLYKLTRTLVSGSYVYSLDFLGTISGTSRVSMADNGTQLMILVPGGDGYIYTVAAGLNQITDLDFTANGNPQYVVFIDGYFACTTDSKKWIVSNLNDGTSWGALDFGTAESDPDITVAPAVLNNQIYITGSETTEAFQNIGGSGFPFQRSNIFLDKGCYAPFTLKVINQSLFMIGGGINERPAIWSYSGGEFVKVSTSVIDTILGNYSDTELNSAFSLTWGTKGQYFISFSFTDRTFIYNITTNLWHEQKSSIEVDGDYQQLRWRVNSLVTAYGLTLVGDSRDGRVGYISNTTYTEYDNPIIRLFSTMPIANKGKSYRIPSIELTMESGVGTGSLNPVISMAISEDGKIFDYERSRLIGKVGEYKNRIIWRKNGRIPRFGVLKFRLSDPIKPVVIKLEVEIA